MSDLREEAAQLLLWLGGEYEDCHRWPEPPLDHVEKILQQVRVAAALEASMEIREEHERVHADGYAQGVEAAAKVMDGRFEMWTRKYNDPRYERSLTGPSMDEAEVGADQIRRALATPEEKA